MIRLILQTLSITGGAKMEYFTVRANSMEEAEWEAENGNELFNFDWEEFDFEIVEIKEEEIPEQQLTLSGIL